MRTALCVINRMHHDPNLDASRCVVGYRDFGRVVEQPLVAFSHWGKIEFADEDELAVPQHRVARAAGADTGGRVDAASPRIVRR